MPHPNRTYEAIILAGHSHEPTPISVETGEPRKALLRIRGHSMLSYVVDALRESGCMRHLVLAGLSADDVPDLSPGCPVTYLTDRHDMVDNALAAVDALQSPDRALMCSTDIPLLTPETVRDFVARCEASGAEFCYSIVGREEMEARFPGSGRSFRPLVDGAFAGGDMSMIGPHVVRRNVDFLRVLTARRKSIWRLVRALGLGIVLRHLTHRLHIRDAEKRAGEILGCSCEAIISPYAELAMDVDKPHQLELVRKAMEER